MGFKWSWSKFLVVLAVVVCIAMLTLTIVGIALTPAALLAVPPTLALTSFV